jgi:hypothetical protein
MDTKKARDLPARLECLRRRFERWRRSCKAHARIPDSLWDAAVVAADRHGVSRTANVLRVNYHALKKRLDRKTAAVGGPEARGEAQFVELTPFASTGSCECVLELEDVGGAKMRVRLQGVGMPDLAALGRSFWDRNRQP